MNATPALLLFLQQTLPQAQAAAEHHGTGREWMVLVSIVAPFIVLLLLAWLGNRKMVH